MIKALLVNMARLNYCRTIWNKLSSRYSDKECYDAFVATMNAQAKKWGMINTKWINPSGLGEDGVYSKSTANDLAIMALHVFHMQGIKYHGQEGCEIVVKKPYIIPWHRFKKKIIYSTTRIEAIGNGFPIIGSKTGSGDGYQTLVMVCDIEGVKVAGAIMNAEDEQGRFEAMDELMRIAYEILHRHAENKSKSVTKARNASLCVMEENGSIKHIFAQNADEESAPMSTTKVMTMMIANRYINDFDRIEYVIPCDLRDDNGDVLHVWDKLSIKDMMAAMMLNSSNVAANAIARIAGIEIFKTGNKE